MAVIVTKDNFKEEISDGKITVADFYSETCVPCKRLSPILEDVEKDYGDKIKFVKVNINSDVELAYEYQVSAVPTLIYFKNGVETERTVGLLRKEDIIQVIDSIIK